MSDLSEALRVAVDAHDGQLDKAGQPYILHPIRVMLTQETEVGRIVALLHDVVEDSVLGHGDILALFGSDVHEAILALSREEGEDYFAYVLRAKANPIAAAVKIADLNDNLDPSRIVANDTNGPMRRAKYRRALKMLKETS